MSETWKHPDYYPDMPPVVASLGRGSPTGVVCYRHEQFPAEYRGAIFVADWTFGRIVALPLTRDGDIDLAGHRFGSGIRAAAPGGTWSRL